MIIARCLLLLITFCLSDLFSRYHSMALPYYSVNHITCALLEREREREKSYDAEEWISLDNFQYNGRRDFLRLLGHDQPTTRHHSVSLLRPATINETDRHSTTVQRPITHVWSLKSMSCQEACLEVIITVLVCTIANSTISCCVKNPAWFDILIPSYNGCPEIVANKQGV